VIPCALNQKHSTDLKEENMPINICFILYPWEKIAPVEDSSIRLIHEACMRGHNVGIVYPNNLSIRKSITTGYAKIIRKSEKSVKNISTFYKNTKFREQSVPLAGFDVVFVRTNPPLDPVMLNFLDSVRHDTFIINDIDGLRKANNKLYPAAFEDPENEIIPKTYVSKNVEFLRKVIRGSESEKMILKPFDGFGGSGVIVLEKECRISTPYSTFISTHGATGIMSFCRIMSKAPRPVMCAFLCCMVSRSGPTGECRRLMMSAPILRPVVQL
jgi:glutathione synthase/RimK-type ligase-like ATP-grasp enzyme